MESNSHSKKNESLSNQKTQPKKGEPVEIPVPSKDQIVKDFERIVSDKREDDSDE